MYFFIVFSFADATRSKVRCHENSFKLPQNVIEQLIGTKQLPIINSVPDVLTSIETNDITLHGRKLFYATGLKEAANVFEVSIRQVTIENLLRKRKSTF